MVPIVTRRSPEATRLDKFKKRNIDSITKVHNQFINENMHKLGTQTQNDKRALAAVSTLTYSVMCRAIFEISEKSADGYSEHLAKLAYCNLADGYPWNVFRHTACGDQLFSPADQPLL